MCNRKQLFFEEKLLRPDNFFLRFVAFLVAFCDFLRPNFVLIASQFFHLWNKINTNVTACLLWANELIHKLMRQLCWDYAI